MKVLMISGSYPPDVCGVGDYTFRLVQGLTARGVSVTVLGRKDWRWPARHELLRQIRIARHDVLHIQYPSIGFGYSLVPQFLCLRLPAVVTLHEFYRSRIPRKLASSLFLQFARKLVFTSEFEFNWARRLIPWIARKSSMIPIGTNILPVVGLLPRRRDEVVYFGLITPDKGFEQLLEFAAAAQSVKSGIHLRIIGQVPDSYKDYAAKLMARSRNLPVIWTLDQPDSEVARLLAESSVAYLPFPDGASERRGSLKAIFSSGVTCISTDGIQIPDSLRKVLIFARNGRDAFARAATLLSDESELQRTSARATAYAQTFRWDDIADRHLAIYTKMRIPG